MNNNTPKRIASEETLVRVAEALETMASAQTAAIAAPKTWKDVQTIVRRGLANKVFSIGDQFIVERATSASATVSGSGITEASVTLQTFIDKLGYVSSGLYDFSYNGAVWLYNDTPVTLSEYGITSGGTASAGDHIIVSLMTTELVFDIIGIDHDVPADGQFTHSLTLNLHDLTNKTVPFDNTEAIFFCDVQLNAGTYHFSIEPGYDVNYGGGRTYQFTITEAVPAGGVILFDWKHNTQASEAQILTYDSASALIAQETVGVEEGAGGTALNTLGELNDIRKARFGSNDYYTSFIRQWLNSDAPKGSIWTAQTQYDRPCNSDSTLDGFLYLLDQSFLNVVGSVKKTTTIDKQDNTSPETIETEEKFYLLSIDEIFSASENGLIQGMPYAYYSNYSSSSLPHIDADDIRIKYQGDSAKYYWLRSPNLTYKNSIKYVYPDGSIHTYSLPNSELFVSPSCCIV